MAFVCPFQVKVNDIYVKLNKPVCLFQQIQSQTFLYKQNIPKSTQSFKVKAEALKLGNAPATKPWKTKDARLVLEDGSIWRGASFGSKGTKVGEIVFNTAMTGYQEVMTDPSYEEQFVVFTHPHIGNTGINSEDFESSKCHLGAIIVRDLSCSTSNYRANQTLEEFCEKEGVMGIENIDTRLLTRTLRNYGCMVGVLSTDKDISDEDLIQQTKTWTIRGKDLLKVVSCHEPYVYNEATDAEWEFSTKATKDRKFKVVAYDFGVKRNILKRLVSLGCEVTVVPADYSTQKVLDMNPDGIFLSNGPGDPEAAPYAVENTKKLIGKKPIFGICMGHQILGQALGGKIFKLKFGHHGANHPIRQNHGTIEISSQNHNYAIESTGLPKNVEISHINLNDGSCAGLICKDKQVLSIQYHPEASPGPHDSDVCFDLFIQMMEESKSKTKQLQTA